VVDNEKIISELNKIIRPLSRNVSSKEKSNIKTIIQLCLRYNFKYQFVSNYAFIYSIIDQWYFDYTNNQVVKLFHKNKFHSINQYHFQKKFSNIKQTIKYIKQHDDFYYTPNQHNKHDKIYKKITQANKKIKKK
jgi:hypothetical protein